MDLDLGPGVIIDPTVSGTGITVGASSLVGQVEYDALALSIQRPIIISIQYGQEWNSSTFE